MNKLLVFLIASTIGISTVSGLLFNKLILVQNENSELRVEIFDVNSQIEQQRAASSQIESQITEFEEQLRNNTNKVKITEFRFEGFAFPPVTPMTYCSDYIVSVENFEAMMLKT